MMATTSGKRLDVTDYYVTGKCCSCENPAVKFEARGGAIFELCQFHGRPIKKDSPRNGRR